MTRSYYKTAVAFLGCVAAAAVARATGPATTAVESTASHIDISFAARSVTAKGVTPHTETVFFAIGRIPLLAAHMMSIVRWRQVVADDDGDGTVTLKISRDIPSESVWVVADLTNGDYAVARPGGAARDSTLSSNPLRKHGNRIDAFSFEYRSVDLLYVHPGRGAWWWRARDGSPGDTDGLNGRATVSAVDATPLLGRESKLAEFAPGGTLLAIDYQTLDVVSIQVDVATLGGAQ